MFGGRQTFRSTGDGTTAVVSSPPCSVQLVRSPPSAFPREKRGQPQGHGAQGQPGGQSFRDWSKQCPCLTVCLLLCRDPVWEGLGRTGVGWGGSAYRGGAGGENVITRSSLLKVRHRLVGTEFMGEGVTEGWGWAGAWRPPQSVPQSSTRSPCPRDGRLQTNTTLTLSPHPPPGEEVGLEAQRVKTKTKWVDSWGGQESRCDRETACGCCHSLSLWVSQTFQLLAQGSRPSAPPARQSSKQTPPTAFSIPESPHTSLRLQQGPGPSPTTKVTDGCTDGKSDGLSTFAKS